MHVPPMGAVMNVWLYEQFKHHSAKTETLRASGDCRNGERSTLNSYLHSAQMSVIPDCVCTCVLTYLCVVFFLSSVVEKENRICTATSQSLSCFRGFVELLLPGLKGLWSKALQLITVFFSLQLHWKIDLFSTSQVRLLVVVEQVKYTGLKNTDEI